MTSNKIICRLLEQSPHPLGLDRQYRKVPLQTNVMEKGKSNTYIINIF